MASSDDEFDAYIQHAIDNPIVAKNDSESDISVSSVDTADLSDFEQEDEDGATRTASATLPAPAWSTEYSPIEIPEFDSVSGPPLPQKKLAIATGLFSSDDPKRLLLCGCCTDESVRSTTISEKGGS